MPKCKDCANPECIWPGAETREGLCDIFVKRPEAPNPPPVSPSKSSELLSVLEGGKFMAFKEERKWFEKWVKEQFKVAPAMFSRSGDAYADENINAMFISFCAGWMLNR